MKTVVVCWCFGRDS